MVKRTFKVNWHFFKKDLTNKEEGLEYTVSYLAFNHDFTQSKEKRELRVGDGLKEKPNFHQIKEETSFSSKTFGDKHGIL